MNYQEIYEAQNVVCASSGEYYDYNDHGYGNDYVDENYRDET